MSAHCPDCGGEEIVVRAWVHANTHSFIEIDTVSRDDGKPLYYCDECKTDIEPCTKDKQYCRCGEPPENRSQRL